MAAAFVYLLRCADDTLYCGWTTDLEARLAAHNAGTGAKYTRGRRPVVLAYHEECPDRSAALKREWRIKRLTRLAKEQLVRIDVDSAASLSGDPALGLQGPLGR